MYTDEQKANVARGTRAAMARLDVLAKLRTDRECAACGKTFTGYGSQRYCEAKCRPSYYLLKVYGVSRDEFDTLRRRAAGKCMICRQPFTKREPCLDHDHVTDRPRGLLCKKCNFGLGSFQDDPALLQAAAAYLATE